MTFLFLQSDARTQFRRIPMHLVSSADGVTPANGENGGQPQITYLGVGVPGAFINTVNTLNLVSNGFYYLTLDVTELANTGGLVIRYKSGGTLEAQMDGQVVAFDPYSGPWQTIGGTGVQFTYTVYDQTPGKPPLTPLPNVNVWVTTDGAGANVVASGVSNQMGQITFQLIAGTYYFWQNRSGYNFTNPVQQVVS